MTKLSRAEAATADNFTSCNPALTCACQPNFEEGSAGGMGIAIPPRPKQPTA